MTEKGPDKSWFFRRNPQLGIRREKVQNSRRFLVAALLGMTRNCKLLATTGRSDLRNVPFPAVIPNVVRNPQLGIRRETVQNSRRFLVAALLGMTRNCKLFGMARNCKLFGMARNCKLFGMARGRKLLATTGRSDLRNVPFPAVIPNPLLPCHSEPLTPVSFRT
jgi:hypothetical protein